MDNPAIEVERLGKRYRIGAAINRHRTIRDALAAHAHRMMNTVGRRLRGDFRRQVPESIWALRDIDFSVGTGETIGIIGRNGAGKSTLLKILSRITEPTTGRARINGRVGSLLEVGTGFHPELTGRENTYLNGAILGMGRTEIDRKFDEIVAFAGVERFIDTPVKHYSSGMHLRLAFAVAAHLEPEILIVDEVLAVGDVNFQKKCLGKMGAVASEGRTVLFVSHNLLAIQRLCHRVIHIDGGRLVNEGPPGRVISEYLETASDVMQEREWSDHDPENSKAGVRFVKARVGRDGPGDYDVLTVRTPIRLDFEFDTHLPQALLNLSIKVSTVDEVTVFNTVSTPQHFGPGRVKGTCRIPADLLNSERYRVEVLIVEDLHTVLLKCPDALVFDVADIEREVAYFAKWGGVVRPRLDWEIQYIPENTSSSIQQQLTAGRNER